MQASADVKPNHSHEQTLASPRSFAKMLEAMMVIVAQLAEYETSRSQKLMGS